MGHTFSPCLRLELDRDNVTGDGTGNFVTSWQTSKSVAGKTLLLCVFWVLVTTIGLFCKAVSKV